MQRLFNPNYILSIKKIIWSSLFFIIVFVLFQSCSDSPKEKVTIEYDSLIYDKDGKLFTGIKKGSVNGKIIEYEVTNGIKNGFFLTYYENGSIEIEGQIKENKNVGLWKYYYPEGIVESEGNFKDDLVEGKWYWYYPSGKLKETSEYKNGLREGKNIMYNEDGEITSEILFVKGVEIKDV